VALQILLNDTYKLNHCKEMGAKLGRRFLKQPAGKLKAVFVALYGIFAPRNRPKTNSIRWH